MHKAAIRIIIGTAVAMAVMAATAAAATGPEAVFPAISYKFEPVMEGGKVVHDFVIENHGDAPLVIKNIRPD